MGDYNDQNNNTQMNGNTEPSQNQQPQNEQYQQPQNEQPVNEQYQQPQGQYQYQQPQYGGQSQQYQQSQNQSNYQQYQQYQQPLQRSDNGMAVGALVCGIVSLLFSCCFGIVSLITGIVSAVLAIMYLKKHNSQVDKNGRTMAIIAIVLAAIGLLSGIISIIGCSVLVNSPDFWNDIYNFDSSF